MITQHQTNGAAHGIQVIWSNKLATISWLVGAIRGGTENIGRRYTLSQITSPNPPKKVSLDEMFPAGLLCESGKSYLLLEHVTKGLMHQVRRPQNGVNK